MQSLLPHSAKARPACQLAAADIEFKGVTFPQRLPHCRYVGERPWAGLRPVHIFARKTRDGARLSWPPGAPKPYRRLSDACLAPDPEDRPPSAAVEAALQVRRWTAAHWRT